MSIFSLLPIRTEALPSSPDNLGEVHTELPAGAAAFATVLGEFTALWEVEAGPEGLASTPEAPESLEEGGPPPETTEDPVQQQLQWTTGQWIAGDAGETLADVAEPASSLTPLATRDAVIRDEPEPVTSQGRSEPVNTSAEAGTAGANAPEDPDGRMPGVAPVADAYPRAETQAALVDADPGSGRRLPAANTPGAQATAGVLDLPESTPVDAEVEVAVARAPVRADTPLPRPPDDAAPTRDSRGAGVAPPAPESGATAPPAETPVRAGVSYVPPAQEVRALPVAADPFPAAVPPAAGTSAPVEVPPAPVRAAAAPVPVQTVESRIFAANEAAPIPDEAIAPAGVAPRAAPPSGDALASVRAVTPSATVVETPPSAGPAVTPGSIAGPDTQPAAVHGAQQSVPADPEVDAPVEAVLRRIFGLPGPDPATAESEAPVAAAPPERSGSALVAGTANRAASAPPVAATVTPPLAEPPAGTVVASLRAPAVNAVAANTAVGGETPDTPAPALVTAASPESVSTASAIVLAESDGAEVAPDGDADGGHPAPQHRVSTARESTAPVTVSVPGNVTPEEAAQASEVPPRRVAAEAAPNLENHTRETAPGSPAAVSGDRRGEILPGHSDRPVSTVEGTGPPSGLTSGAAPAPAVARSTAAAPQAVIQSTLPQLEDSIVREVRLTELPGSRQITIRLVPESLGELRLEIQSTNDEMHVRLVTAHAHVRDSLDSQVQQLRESLTRQGFDAPRIEVTVDPGGSHQGGRWSHQDREAPLPTRQQGYTGQSPNRDGESGRRGDGRNSWTPAGGLNVFA